MTIQVLRAKCWVLGALLVAALAGVTLVAQQPPDRSHPPQAGPPPALNLPAIQKQKLSNGLPVWVVELHEVPVVQVNLLALSGSSSEPGRKFGIASLTAAMLHNASFLPPEVLFNFQEINPLADQFSLAAVIYHLLTGAPVLDLHKEVRKRYSSLLRRQHVPPHD